MPRECPVCGAGIAAQDARFCRLCGAPLRAAGEATDKIVSPVAPTAPLMDESRATSGLAAEESQRLADHTSRIKRAEMEELLRRVAHDHDGGAAAGSLPLTRSDEPTLKVSTSASAPAAAAASPADASKLKAPGDGDGSAAPSPQASPQARRVGWRFLTLILLGLSLVVFGLAFMALRRSKASNTVGPAAAAPPPPADATQPVAQAPEEQSGAAQQLEPVALASPAATLTPRPTPSPRARETETGQLAATQAPAEPGAAPAPSPPAPPTEQATTEAVATVSPTEHYQRGIQLWATDRRAALQEFRAAVPAVPDAYYYLGSEYYSEGRDVKSLSDGELRAALNYFTRATAGPHSGQAGRYVQALGKEYDRRKKHPRP